MLVLDQSQETIEPTALDLSDQSSSPATLCYTAADLAEWDARLAAHRKDPSTSVPWEQVRAKLMAKYN